MYRLGEAMLLKMVSPFLLDQHQAGGMALSTSDVGLAYGTFGVIALIIGGISGGWIISKAGLKRCVWPMAFALNIPHFFYVYMAFAHPPKYFVFPLVAFEQLGYGFGFSAFMVFLMSICKGEYRTSHFAISTGFMACGMMIPGMLSGLLQKHLGYPMFFVLVCFLMVPGMITIFFLPFNQNKEAN